MFKLYYDHFVKSNHLYFCNFYYRDHPEFRRRKKHVETESVENTAAENTFNQASSETVSMDTEVPESSYTDLFDDSFEQIGNIDIFDFVRAKNDIYQELLASVMKTKYTHRVPNEAVDELLKAMLNASIKSNSVFKKKLKFALEQENGKYSKVSSIS